MASHETSLSRSVEDYLKAIYGLSPQGESASTSAIAEVLSVQPASVTGMVKRMAESGLLEHVPYRGVRLTDSGEREALKVLRRHRIIETYLCQRLGYAWEDVHQEAERLEHAASDRLIEAMAAALAFPSHDPHGAPIPTRAGEIEQIDSLALSDAAVRTVLRVQSVRDEDPETLRSMEAQGLTPGARVVVEGDGPAEGELSVRVGEDGGASRAVRRDLAQRVYVIPEDS